MTHAIKLDVTEQEQTQLEALSRQIDTAVDRITDYLGAKSGHRNRKRLCAEARSLIDAFDQLRTTTELEQEFGADDVDAVLIDADEQNEDDAHEQSEREADEAVGKLADLDRDLLLLLAEHRAVVLRRRSVAWWVRLNEKIQAAARRGG
jgi:hypothetical protein